MSDALSCAVPSWPELDEQRVELLPSRTVLSAFGSWYFGGTGDDGGPGGAAGDGGYGGWGFGGDGGDGGDATVQDNVNNGFIQVNVAIAAPGGPGGYGDGGDADGGDGGDGGDSGDDVEQE